MDNNPRSARSVVTPMLLFSCFCLLVGDVLFGYDTSSFGGILANPVSIVFFQPGPINWSLSRFRDLSINLALIVPKLEDTLSILSIHPFSHRWHLSASLLDVSLLVQQLKSMGTVQYSLAYR